MARILNKIQSDAITAFNADSDIKYEEIKECPLCNGNKFSAIALQDQFGISLETISCSSCGLMLSRNQLTADATKIFYDKYYRRIYEGVLRASLEHGYYKKLYSGWVSSIPAFIGKSDFVVEIGCGGGWNLLPYHKRNIKYKGFDYDSDMIQYGRKTYNLDIFFGGLDEALKTTEHVDYLILSQVVEHLKNPLEFLTVLRPIFSNKGLICITVPSLDYMRHFGGNSTHFDLNMNLQNAHNFTFDEYTLDLLLRKAGYEPILVIGGYALARANPRTKIVQQKPIRARTPSILNTQKHLGVKYRIKKMLPNYLFNILSRTFYFFRPFRTLRYFAINQLGIGIDFK
jgi:hypothetical protein